MTGREVVANIEPDFLIYDNNPVALTKTIKLAPNQGVLERGTVIAFEEDAIGEKGVAWTGDDEQVADCVLCDDVDTTAAGVDEVIGHAYRVGHLARQALKFGNGTGEITPEAEQQLRYAGILLDNVVL